MYRYLAKPNRSVRVSFLTSFEDVTGEEIDIEVEAMIHPAVTARIHADPDDCYEGQDARVEITNVKGIFRPLTDDEANALMER